MHNLRVVIVTGLSGSGKSTALKALEDEGFFAVDNLPVALLPPFLQLRETGEAAKVALVMDLREAGFLESYPRIFKKLRNSGLRLELVFLEASTKVLVRRYSQTRRAHPLSEGGSLSQAIEREIVALQPLRAEADLILDTTDLSVHQLKTRIVETFSSPLNDQRMHISLISFGFKYGLPPEADLVMDVRFLPNPYFVEGLREKSGLDPEIGEFLDRGDDPAKFLERFMGLLDYLLPLYQKEGKAYLTVGLGCTGGRHRSVALVERLGSRLKSAGYRFEIRHRDINLG